MQEAVNSKNLLEQHDYADLLNNITMRQLKSAASVCGPIIHDVTLAGPYAVATAYCIGIRQGVHNERQRIRARASKPRTASQRMKCLLLALDFTPPLLAKAAELSERAARRILSDGGTIYADEFIICLQLLRDATFNLLHHGAGIYAGDGTEATV